jgi:hypothetical protein
LATKYKAIKIAVYEMGLVFHFFIRKSKPPEEVSLLVQGKLAANLTRCADAIKEYLDHFQTLDASFDDQRPSESWFSLSFAFFIAYKLSVKRVEIPWWDVNIARETFDLEYYLSAFRDRLRATSSGTNARGLAFADIDYYSVLPEIFDTARTSYSAARKSVPGTVEKHRVHADIGNIRCPRLMSPATADPPSVFNQRCPVTSYWRNQATHADLIGEINWTAPMDSFGAFLPRSAI